MMKRTGCTYHGLRPLIMATTMTTCADMPGLHLRDTGDGFVAENMSILSCSDPVELLTHFIEGSANRIVGSHALNTSSSRSHCILSIHLVSPCCPLPPSARPPSPVCRQPWPGEYQSHVSKFECCLMA